MSQMQRSEQALEKKYFIKKFSTGIKVDTQKIRGHFTITSYRKYSCKEEVDVVFKGEIFCKIGRTPAQWYGNEIIGIYKNISKVKLNRLLRKSLFEDVRRRCRLFSADLWTYHDIKKIKWN